MIPEEVIGGDIDDILSSVVARVRIFGNVYSYSAGAHKAIKGHHTFLSMIQSMWVNHLIL